MLESSANNSEAISNDSNSDSSNVFVLGILRRFFVVTIITILFLLFTWEIFKFCSARRYLEHYNNSSFSMNETLIIVITPTYRRNERLAELTRLSQTLMHIKNLLWILIEDASKTAEAVERILKRSKIPYTYLYTTTDFGFPKKGWTQRNRALKYIRENYANYNGNAVVYFADDDNTYDIRLFDNYIRNVKTIGVWAVAFAGGSYVEAPHVVNGVITSWDTVYAPNRQFAVDMAGFAVNLKLILSTDASFNFGCTKQVPETCFLTQFNIDKKDAEPFGYNDNPKDILVWHTKTMKMDFEGETHGYVIE